MPSPKSLLIMFAVASLAIWMVNNVAGYARIVGPSART